MIRLDSPQAQTSSDTQASRSDQTAGPLHHEGKRTVAPTSEQKKPSIMSQMTQAGTSKRDSNANIPQERLMFSRQRGLLTRAVENCDGSAPTTATTTMTTTAAQTSKPTPLRTNSKVLHTD
jgi:hypothetical protein